MGLLKKFTTKKPKNKAKVLRMEDEEDEEEDNEEEDEEEDNEEEEEAEDEDNEEEVEIPEKEEKAQLGAIKRHLNRPQRRTPALTQEAIINIFNEFDARLTRLEKHSILVGARD